MYMSPAFSLGRFFMYIQRNIIASDEMNSQIMVNHQFILHPKILPFGNS